MISTLIPKKENKLTKKKTEEEIVKQEEETKEKENKAKQDLLHHWSKILVKEPPKSRTCHTSFIHDSYLYIIGGIDYYFSKEKSKIYYLHSAHSQIRKSSGQEIKVDTLDRKLYPMHLPLFFGPKVCGSEDARKVKNINQKINNIILKKILFLSEKKNNEILN
jgi:hypothetical protein